MSVISWWCDRLRPAHIDGGSIKRVLDVRCIEFLDHFHRRAAVLRNLIDVGPLHQPHANIGVAQAVGRARIAVPVELQLSARQHTVE